MRRSSAILLWLAVVTGSSLPAMADSRAVESLQIELKPEAFVKSAFVTVADIGKVNAADPALKRAVEEMRIAHAPQVGYVEQVSREELNRMIRSRMAPHELNIVWNGAKKAKFGCATQMVAGTALADAAKRYLETELAGRFSELDVDTASKVEDLPVPAGKLEIRPRSADLKRSFAHMPVWVDVYANDELYRSAIVTMAVHASQNVYVAKRDMQEGETVSGADFEVKNEAVSDIATDPAGMLESSFPARIRKPISAGQALTKSALADRAEIFRGDVVKLVANEGGFQVETRAIAQNDSKLGQSVAVRPEQGTGTVMGRVVSAGVVRLDGE